MVKTSTEAVRKYRANNKEKVREYTREQAKLWNRANPNAGRKWKENNLERYKEIGRQHTLKISGWTIESFDAAFIAQNSKCWICGIDLVKTKGFKNTAHADHNHKTKKRRGILCAKCNMVEGHLSKSNVSPTEFIIKLLEYYKVFDEENKMLVPWTEIESFHNIRKFVKAYPENLKGKSTVTYKCKVKLHGTNAGVQVHTDGTIVAQSRTTLLTDGADNAGFAKWVKESEAAWAIAAPGFIYFGEWIGPGVQKGVACSEIPKRAFAIFAARAMPRALGPNPDSRCISLEDGSCIADSCMHTDPSGDDLIVDPDLLSRMVGPHPDIYILPWQSESIMVNFNSSSDELSVKIIPIINLWVALVEKEDPWVEATFGVKGTGEGLVFYPSSEEHLGYKNFTNLVFKAKGEKHKNIKSAAPAQVDASSAANVTQFVDMVLTDARLEQGVGATAVAGAPAFDMKQVGKFLAWVVADVQKETQDELEASGLEWKQVSKPVGDKARAWYLAKAKAL